jgi:acetyl-CoA carboxylase biotin carboxylase subunit
VFRHVEVQVLADKFGNTIHLGERDCSIQRRMQKLVEEGPSPALTPELRLAVGEAAVKAAEAVNYEGAGTVEFIFDHINQKFYFMEMNTRIQVEHTITEMITGIDLVQQQLKIASGEKLVYRQDDIKINGWSIECRINAENPSKNFMPSPGKVTMYMPPGGFGVRVDSAMYTGYSIPPFYDSMVAKLIVHADTREEAVARMKRALDEFIIEGVDTTIPFHSRLMDNEVFKSGDFDTNFLEKHTIMN